MISAELRFYEELNDFLPRELRRQAFVREFPEARSVKDLIESQGVPHTEIDLILVNGESAGFEYLVRDGDRISVYPRFESLDIQAVSRLGRQPLRTPQFIADVHLGKLVRRLRLLGFDCLYDRAWDDPELAARSAAEGRTLLTRDRGLLMRAEVTHGVFLHSDQPDRQLQEILRRLDLYRLARPFSRCVTCNGTLARLSLEDAWRRVPERTRRYVSEFFRCTGCDHTYWRGTHWDRLQELVENALNPAPADACQPPVAPLESYTPKMIASCDHV